MILLFRVNLISHNTRVFFSHHSFFLYHHGEKMASGMDTPMFQLGSATAQLIPIHTRSANISPNLAETTSPLQYFASRQKSLRILAIFWPSQRPFRPLLVIKTVSPPTKSLYNRLYMHIGVLLLIYDHYERTWAKWFHCLWASAQNQRRFHIPPPSETGRRDIHHDVPSRFCGFKHLTHTHGDL